MMRFGRTQLSHIITVTIGMSQLTNATHCNDVAFSCRMHVVIIESYLMQTFSFLYHGKILSLESIMTIDVRELILFRANPTK